MKLPRMDEYQSAIQNPRTAFSDAELMECEVGTGPFGMPRPRSGGYVLTYHLVGKSEWAIRCFYRDVHDLRRRYDAIGQFIDRTPNKAFVQTRLIQRGIRVQGSWYPIIKMTWIRGDPINHYIEKNISAPRAISWLPQAFRDLSESLERLGIAHGDLQHGNIMVSENSLRLVDYDGVFLPELQDLRGDQVGHPNYQHPSRGSEHYDATLDRFSSLLIYVALLAIAECPSLYMKYGDGENLLFKRTDILSPADSLLFKDLSQLSAISTLVNKLKVVCEADVDIQKIPKIGDFIGAAPSSFKLPRVKLRPPPIAPVQQVTTSQYVTIEAGDLRTLLEMYGQITQITGTVTSVYFGETKYGKPYAFLNFGSYKQGCFYLVVWSQALDLFDKTALKNLKGKRICVTGLLSRYNDSPTMQIDMPSQIQLLTEGQVATPSVMRLSPARAPTKPIMPIPRISRRTSSASKGGLPSQVDIDQITAPALTRLYAHYPTQASPSYSPTSSPVTPTHKMKPQLMKRHSPFVKGTRTMYVQAKRRTALRGSSFSSRSHLRLPSLRYRLSTIDNSRLLSQFVFLCVIASLPVSVVYSLSQFRVFPIVVTDFQITQVTTRATIVTSQYLRTMTKQSTHTRLVHDDEIMITVTSYRTTTATQIATRRIEDTVRFTTTATVHSQRTLLESSSTLSIILMILSLVVPIGLTIHRRVIASKRPAASSRGRVTATRGSAGVATSTIVDMGHQFAKCSYCQRDCQCSILRVRYRDQQGEYWVQKEACPNCHARFKSEVATRPP